MASTSEKEWSGPTDRITVADWERQAAFMRAHGAIHAEWGEIDGRTVLTKLVLAPHGPPRPPTVAPTPENTSKGIAKKLLQSHEIQFAASRFKPPFAAPAEKDSDVPRALRMKKDTPTRGSKKVSKRGS